MEEQPAVTIMEEREELMIPPTGGKPTLRTAYFLNPTVQASICEENNLFSFSRPSKLIIPESKKKPLTVRFAGWRCPLRGWKSWVDQLKPKYEDTWKKAGIFEAILASKYHTLRDNDLIRKLAEKWCLETNTFVFSWGEATITLEDIMVLGGYSVLGDFAISSPLRNRRSEDTLGLDLEVEEKLIEAYKDIGHSCGQFSGLQYHWMDHFKASGYELEHEAFLVLWLSRWVFPVSCAGVRKDVFHIAVCLSRGIPIALAPPVLASIYKNMGLLKKSLIASIEPHNESKLILAAPLQFVQLWAWERFPTLRPKPKPLEFGEPRSARWHRLKSLKVEDVRKVLDSAGECFQWRPYTIVVKNWNFEKFYKESEQYVMVDSGVDFEVESWIRCLRNSELVGINCLEQYLPHRVAMQFGFDQDIPGFVNRSNDQTPRIAWRNYMNRPVRDAKLYLPARLFESDVTKRYLEWWEKLKLEQENAARNDILPGLPYHFHVVQKLDQVTFPELNSKWAQTNEEIGKSGSHKILPVAQNLSSSAAEGGAVKTTESVTNSLKSDHEKTTMDNANRAKRTESSKRIDKEEEECYKDVVGSKPLEPKTEATNDELVAVYVQPPSEYAKMSEQIPALPETERLNRKDGIEKLEARITYLEKIVGGIEVSKYSRRKHGKDLAKPPLY